MKIAILYYRYLTPDGEQFVIGGIETYLRQLAELFTRESHTVYIVQLAEFQFQKERPEAIVCGIPAIAASRAKQRAEMYAYAKGLLGQGESCLIFGADHCSVPTAFEHHIAIQHGVGWDLPSRFRTRRAVLSHGLGAKAERLRMIRRALADFDNCLNRVCVDYNFLNWYRIQKGRDPDGNVAVIPNACPVPPTSDVSLSCSSSSGITRVIFARRLQEYRGTRVMCEAIELLLPAEPGLHVVFAGEGPDGAYLRERFVSEPRVTFMDYAPGDGVKVHLDFDIAVIPSLGSEGTSLSVAEAMAAGCLVIASPVGGITNMVINGYNGLLVPPTPELIASSLRWAIQHPEDVARIRASAHDTARHGFDISTWERRWSEFLERATSG